jgi:poly(A) polymerase Pap1
MISILLRYSRTKKNQTKKRALPALHKKEDFFYKYRFFRNQSACGGR